MLLEAPQIWRMKRYNVLETELVYKDAQGACIIITLALALATLWCTVHLKEETPAGYPFTTPGSREPIVDKMPCLGAYAMSGIQTYDPVKSMIQYTTNLEKLYDSA